MELMDLGGPPSMDSDNVWSAATNSTEWKLPSFTVSTLRKREKEIEATSLILQSLDVRHVFEQKPVYCRRRVGSSVVADPEAPPVQLHCYVIIVTLVQQDAAVLISSNL